MDTCTAIAAAPSVSHRIHASGQELVLKARLLTLPSTDIPQIQQAVITPEVGPELDVRYSKIPVRLPAPGEVVVKIAWTGVCRSVCLNIHLCNMLTRQLLGSANMSRQTGSLVLERTITWVCGTQPYRRSRRHWSRHRQLRNLFTWPSRSCSLCRRYMPQMLGLLTQHPRRLRKPEEFPKAP